MEKEDPDFLLARAASGDRSALDHVLREQYDRIYAVCRRMTGNDADAADAAQEALIAVSKGLGRFERRSRLTTWVYRVAVNASIDEIRRRSRRPGISIDAFDSSPTSADSGTSHEEAITAGLDVDAALRRLPVEFRAPVVLRDLCGLDYQEIGEVLRLPAGTVRSRISRGRAGLAKMLALESDA